MDALEQLYERMNSEPWIHNINLRIWGHGIYVVCVFERMGRDNGADVWLNAADVQGLIDSGELQKAEGIASWTRGMGDGYFIQHNQGCNWNDVCYTTGIECFHGEEATMDHIMKFLKGKFDILVERAEYLEKIQKERRVIEACEAARAMDCTSMNGENE